MRETANVGLTLRLCCTHKRREGVHLWHHVLAKMPLRNRCQHPMHILDIRQHGQRHHLRPAIILDQTRAPPPACAIAPGPVRRRDVQRRCRACSRREAGRVSSTAQERCGRRGVVGTEWRGVDFRDEVELHEVPIERLYGQPREIDLCREVVSRTYSSGESYMRRDEDTLPCLAALIWEAICSRPKQTTDTRLKYKHGSSKILTREIRPSPSTRSLRAAAASAPPAVAAMVLTVTSTRFLLRRGSPSGLSAAVRFAPVATPAEAETDAEAWYAASSGGAWGLFRGAWGREREEAVVGAPAVLEVVGGAMCVIRGLIRSILMLCRDCCLQVARSRMAAGWRGDGRLLQPGPAMPGIQYARGASRPRPSLSSRLPGSLSSFHHALCP